MPEGSGMKYIKSWKKNKKHKKLSTKNSTSAKLSFKNEGEIKIFPAKQKLREFINSRPSLQEMLKGVLQAEIQGYQTVTQSCKEK